MAGEIQISEVQQAGVHLLFEEVDRQITRVHDEGYETSDLTAALDEVWEKVVPIEARKTLREKGLLPPIETTDEEV